MPKSNGKNSDIRGRYERAMALEREASISRKSNGVAFNTTIFPHWIGVSDCFWYLRETRDGQTFRRVNAKDQSNIAAFDHDVLTKTLQAAAGEVVAADNLPLTDLDLTQAPTQIHFCAFNKRWSYNEGNQTCEELTVDPDSWKISPDGKRAVFVRDYNLWLRDLTTGNEKALTLDGERFNEYASAQPASVYGLQGQSRSVEALWSPDSKRLFTLVVDIRKVKVGPPLVQQVPTDGSLRPKILRPDRRVAFPGDEHIEAFQFLVIDIDSGAIRHADYRPCPVTYPPIEGYFTSQRGWWDADGRHAYFVDQERGGKVINLVKLDTDNGSTEVLFKETSDVAVTLIPKSHSRTLLVPLQNSNELIWFSERSGWGHLYLYDMASGALKKPITQGDWLVRSILHVDVERRELIIQTAGRHKGRNPYYCDICRVNIDSGKLTTIISSDHEYVVLDQRSRIALKDMKAIGVSPSGRYVVTTRSRVDEIPVSLLLSCAEGESAENVVGDATILETADVSGLPENWQWPEPLMLKAEDGETDIDCVVFRPSDFDPSKSYPVLDCSYGYVSPIGSFSNNSSGGWQYFSPAAYAELGFIAVCINNRGNDGLRDSAFNDYEYSDFPLDPQTIAKTYKSDCIAGIKQLAKIYPYIDINRVGVVDFGSRPHALTGMLVHPEFYKVGVSVCAMVDTRMFAAFGREEAGNYPNFEARAHRLSGKLLIIHGMLEWCLHIPVAFRLIEALQKANKRFDMLLLPNQAHGHTNYTLLRSWDYVVEHLRAETPPEDLVFDDGIWDANTKAECAWLEADE